MIATAQVHGFLCECEEPFTWIANTSVLLHVFPSKCKEKKLLQMLMGTFSAKKRPITCWQSKRDSYAFFHLCFSFFLEIPLSSFISPWDVIGMCVCFLNGCSWGVDDTIRVDGHPSHYHKITKSTKNERNQQKMLSFVQRRELENMQKLVRQVEIHILRNMLFRLSSSWYVSYGLFRIFLDTYIWNMTVVA